MNNLLNQKLNELETQGFTRITSNEYSNLHEIMNVLDNKLDLNKYSYGLCEHRLGYDYLEIVSIEED